MELQGQQMRQLTSLKREYNTAIKRFNKMQEWCKTASLEEQGEHYNLIVEVINTCNNLLNEIKELDKFVTDGEILRGFKI